MNINPLMLSFKGYHTYANTTQQPRQEFKNYIRFRKVKPVDPSEYAVQLGKLPSYDWKDPLVCKVTENIYRGPKPLCSKDLKILKEKCGIDTIISLKPVNAEILEDTKTKDYLNGFPIYKTKIQGLKLIDISDGEDCFNPWEDKLSSTKSIENILEYIDSNKNNKFYIHCRKGAMQTSYLIAAYRIAKQGWHIYDAYTDQQKALKGSEWQKMYDAEDHIDNFINGLPPEFIDKYKIKVQLENLRTIEKSIKKLNPKKPNNNN